MTPKLTNDIEQIVEQNHGFMQVDGQRTSYVVVSLDAYREMMGVGSDEELGASLKAIKEASPTFTPAAPAHFAMC